MSAVIIIHIFYHSETWVSKTDAVMSRDPTAVAAVVWDSEAPSWFQDLVDLQSGNTWNSNVQFPEANILKFIKFKHCDKITFMFQQVLFKIVQPLETFCGCKHVILSAKHKNAVV